VFRFAILIGVFASLTSARAVDASSLTTYHAGAAQIDITPDFPIRLAGFASRHTESEGITQRIHASALAIDDGGDPVVLVTADLCGVPAAFTEQLLKRLEPLNVRPERFTLAVTHSHTTPMVAGYLPTLFGQPIPPEHQRHIARFTAELLDKLERAVKTALADRRPARLSWGVGSVEFAKNRRAAGGPIDHDLPVLAVRDPDGKLRAVWASYACHCVTLSNNKISGDWAGFAKEAIESENLGAIALISVGCGADQNPNSGVTGDKVEKATTQGREVAAEVKRLLAGFLAPINGPITARAHVIDLPLADPLPRSAWEAKAQSTDPKQQPTAYYAKVQLARLDRGEALATKVDFPVKAWKFGDDLALAFLPGEVVVDYGLRLKKELDGRRVWINAYSNAVPCYIPSERVLKEGGYEGGGAMVYYDLPGPFKLGLEQAIVDSVKAVVGDRFKPQFDPAKTNGRPLSPQQSSTAIRTRPGVSVELMAAEPLVDSPVAIAFGPDGRLWVAEMYDYPSGSDGNFRPAGRVRVLSSSHGDGKYDQASVFLDNIPFPTGVTVWRNGLLVCAAPDILYAEDTRGTGKADIVKKLYSGFGTDNYQARVNSLEFGLDGWVYGSCGLFGGTITSFTGKKIALGNRDFRIKPDTGDIEPATGRTQQGRVRDDWDNWFGCDNTHLAWHYPLPDHYIRRNPHAAPPDPAVLIGGDASTLLFPAGNQQLFKLSGPPGRPTAACGIGVYRDDLLGKDVTGDLFVCEPVNLLVHRMKLKPNGSTFASVRPPGEEQSEFLTCTDPWFRPVQVRTGPDGCLWVVDMHRHVIEHPRWIPPEDLAKLDVRAGATLGRTFRVRPADREPRRFPRLDKLDNAGLVAALDSPNGWQRDLAMQMLFWRDAEDAAPALARLAAECPRPEGRLHALCTLDGLGGIRRDTIQAALGDSHPGVRRQAARLAENFGQRPGPVWSKMALLSRDTNEQVRLQTAFSLGEMRDEAAGNLLLEMARTHPDDPYLIAALLSGIRPDNLGAILFAATKAGLSQLPIRLLEPLLTTAVATGDRAELSHILNTLATAPTSRESMRALAILLEAIGSGGKSIDAIADAKTRDSIDRAIGKARTIAADTRVAVQDRLAALALLSRLPAERELFASLLTPRQPAEVQAAAAAALARSPTAGSAAALLAGWPSYSPALRSQILDMLLTRTAGTKLLLAAFEQKTVPVAQIDAAHRQRLATHKDAEVRARAARLFASSINPDRQKIVTAYQDALKLNGDANHGRLVFTKTCSVCHQLEKIGHVVGPDLAQLANKSPAYLLQEVLDPNRNVDSRYIEYRASTKTGREFSGVLAAESASSITLRTQEGREQVVLRDDLESLESTGRSLMPEGLEKDLSRQDLADLFAFITRPKTEPPKP
jgi:putative membrane-bound dehydrogenase-like protein